MSLDFSKLKNVRKRGGKVIARCPACGEAGRDQKGEHLVINSDGRFGCVVYPGDSADAKEHRKRIFALCGDREIKPLVVHPSGVGRSGRVNRSQLAETPLKTGLLGRLGRVFETHLEPEPEPTHCENHNIDEHQRNDCGKGVPGVPSVVANDVADVLSPFLYVAPSDLGPPTKTERSGAALGRAAAMTPTPIAILQKAADLDLSLSFTPPETLEVKTSGPWPKSFADTLRTHKAQLLGLLQLPFVMVDSEILGETIFFCADDDTRTALIEAGADEFSIYTKDELRVLCEANRVAAFTPAELRMVHEIKRTFNGRVAR